MDPLESFNKETKAEFEGYFKKVNTIIKSPPCFKRVLSLKMRFRDVSIQKKLAPLLLLKVEKRNRTVPNRFFFSYMIKLEGL